MFFNKPVSKLTLAQAALLAGLPQSPSQYNPFIDKAAALHRRQEVLQAMVAAHYITQAQADSADRARLQVHHNYGYSVRKEPYVFDYIAQAAARDLCPKTPNNCPTLYGGGLKIYSTIDLRKQALARPGDPRPRGRTRASPAPGWPRWTRPTATSSPSPPRATTTRPSFDYATQAHRQPGSSFKLFVLMTLIHDFHGDPSQTFYNSHFLAPGWLPGYPTYSVHTAELSYLGNISVTKATAASDNTVFAQLDADLTPAKVTQTAYAMGITTPSRLAPGRGHRRTADRRHPAGDGRRLLDARQRRLPRPGHDHQQDPVPRRQRARTSAIPRRSGSSPTARPTRRPTCSRA